MMPKTRRSPGLEARATSTTPIAASHLNGHRRQDGYARRPHRAPVGHYARGYREGYAAALRWIQSEFGEHLDEIGRARLAAVVARSEAA